MSSIVTTRNIVRAVALPFSLALALAAAGCSSAPLTDTESESSALSLCGGVPHATPCNTLVCVGDSWEFNPTKPGSGCETAAGAHGTCEGGNATAHTAATCVVNNTVKSQKVYPSYYVLTLLYSAPGIGSEVDYGATSTIGSEVDIQNLTKLGTTIQASGKILGNGAMAQFGFAAGGVDGTSVEVSKTESSTLSLASQEDVLTHNTDTFYLWTNAEIDLAETGTQPVTTQLTSRNGADPIIVPVSVAELKNRSLMPAWKTAELTALTTADYAAILTLDPLVPKSLASQFVVATPPNPARYTKITSLQLDGPDAPNDPVTGFGVAVTNEHTNGTVNGYNTAVTASVTLDTGSDVFGLFSSALQLGFTAEWDYQQTTASKTGASQTATVTLKTTTVDYHEVVDVYYDTVYNSFAFSYPTVSSVFATGSQLAAARATLN